MRLWVVVTGKHFRSIYLLVDVFVELWCCSGWHECRERRTNGWVLDEIGSVLMKGECGGGEGGPRHAKGQH